MKKLKTREEKLAIRRPTVRKYRNKIRLKALEKLGGKCKKCGFSDWRALQVDHVNGWGSEERRMFKDTYTYLKHILNDTTGKYQLLCANCNWIKRYEQYEEKGKVKGRIYEAKS